MKTVVEFIPELLMGGAETLVKDYALLLDKKKIKLTVLCSIKFGSPYEKILTDAGVRLIFLNDYSKKKPNNISKLFIWVMRHFKIRHFFKKEKPDVIHIHLGLCRYMRFAGVARETRILYTAHNEPSFLWGKNKKEFNAVKWLVKKYQMRFIALTQQAKEEINSLFHVNDTIILNNGIDFSKFNNILQKNEVRKKIGIPEQSFVIGHVGRFEKQKNHEFIVNIFSHFLSLRKNGFLLLVGNGSLKNEIDLKLSNSVGKDKYMILSNRTDVPSLLSAMDFFLFPSLFEGLPVTLIEAQKVGLPCIVSDEIKHDVEISNLIDFYSLKNPASEWAEKISNYIPSKIEYYGLSDWDMNNVIRKLEKIYLGEI